MPPAPLIMWANNGGRRIGVVPGRFFSSAPWRRTATSGAAGRSASASSQSQQLNWSGRSVFALSATAGLLGFGLAALRIEHPKPRPVVLFDSKIASPQYASTQEMETVSRACLSACGPITDEHCPQALKEMRREIGDVDGDLISTDPDDLHAHGYSEWSTTNPDGLPVAVAYPRSTAQVSTLARICYKYRIPIIPYSGGSSLEGNFSAPYGGISIDFAYMDQIVQFNKEDMDVVVQPSMGWQDLNEQLAKMDSGLFFPIDPGMPSGRVSFAAGGK